MEPHPRPIQSDFLEAATHYRPSYRCYRLQQVTNASRVQPESENQLPDLKDKSKGELRAVHKVWDHCCFQNLQKNWAVPSLGLWGGVGGWTVELMDSQPRFFTSGLAARSTWWKHPLPPKFSSPTSSCTQIPPCQPWVHCCDIACWDDWFITITTPKKQWCSNSKFIISKESEK